MTRRRSGVERFRGLLGEYGLADTIAQTEDNARTAPEAAAALACPLAAIVKSLVFVEPDQTPRLVLACGDARVDEAALAEQLGVTLHLADAPTVRTLAGYALGGVPPFDHVQPLHTIIDRRVFEQARVWAAAGSPRALFSLTPDELLRATGGKPLALGG